MINIGHFDEDRWQLFHVDEDRSEALDLAAKHPDKVQGTHAAVAGGSEEEQRVAAKRLSA